MKGFFSVMDDKETPSQGFKNSGESENIDSLNPGYDILNDFSNDQLGYEMMKLGMDPSNLDVVQMKKILVDKMKGDRSKIYEAEITSETKE